jgi:hypothetical protein
VLINNVRMSADAEFPPDAIRGTGETPPPGSWGMEREHAGAALWMRVQAHPQADGCLKDDGAGASGGGGQVTD